MAVVSMTGQDSVLINNRVFNDLGDGDSVTLTFPNEIVDLKVGKNGNTVYAYNETGRQAEVALRLIRGSSDDKFLNNILASQKANFAGFVLLIGEFIKRIGDGQGGISNDTYILSGGVISKEVETKTNVEGDTEQSISMYTFKFSNAPRVIA